jgi:hypothetical protein
MREELNLKPGMVVCDLGSGNGYHTLPMAKSVAPGGAACDHLSYEVTARKPDVVAVYAAGLRVASNQLEKDGSGGWEITGTVVNEGDRRARYVQVQVLALDVAGRIVGVNSVFAKGDLLEAGASTRFRLGPVRYLDPPDRFEFSAYGRTAD